MTFAEKLRAARMRAGFTQERLSLELGVTKRTIINYESGKTTPPVELLSKIADLFDITIEGLVTEEEGFVSEAYEQSGSRGAREAEALINELGVLFAGGRLSDEEKDSVMRAIQNAYWVAKEESKRKYTPKKYRNEEQTQ